MPGAAIGPEIAGTGGVAAAAGERLASPHRNSAAIQRPCDISISSAPLQQLLDVVDRAPQRLLIDPHFVQREQRPDPCNKRDCREQEEEQHDCQFGYPDSDTTDTAHENS